MIMNKFDFMEVTVKQTPLTAILSPIFVSSRILFALIQSWEEIPFEFMLFIVPISSIIPVNI